MAAENDIAPSVRGCLIAVRAYDAGEVCVYDLGQVCDGTQPDAPPARALADSRTAFVNIQPACPGCWLTRVERTA